MKKLAIGVALLGLAGCDRSAPEAVETVNEANLTSEVELLNETVQPLPPAPSLSAEVGNAVAPPPPPAPPLPDDEQIQEDADASGMTARLPAEEDSAPADGVAEDK